MNKLQIDNQKLLENIHVKEKSYEEKIKNLLAENEIKIDSIKKKTYNKINEFKINFTQQKESILAKHQKEVNGFLNSFYILMKFFVAFKFVYIKILGK